MAEQQEFPPDHCCASGFLATGEPKGTEATFGGLNSYVAVPKEKPTTCVLIVTDVFGYKLVNTRLIADAFAEAGFLCVIPDLLGDAALPADILETKPADELSKLSWGDYMHERFLKKAKLVPTMMTLIFSLSLSKVMKDIDGVLAGITEKYGITAFGAQGYCWGGKHSIVLTHKPQVKAAVVAHPSRLSLPDDIQKMSAPGLFLCAGKDFDFGPKKYGQAEQILKKKKETGSGPDYGFHIYETAPHGFGTRSEPGNKECDEIREDHVKRSIEFYKKYLVA
ncbi:hypothetical protein BZG36_01588 [Bifiguratus adelaidae]|uniref:Dienelactone hydrolase domain-containing protein n=1 Tax=Bifiguratus adelaidae TaxID=1938954 RepID=A0A261Y4B9_9FUNG|nr:hypothetical protein BZG36_01588 [Bifiguratus adelaidae]